MKRRNIAEVRRCCNGSVIMRGRASLVSYFVGGIMKNVKAKNEPAAYVWGVKNPQKVANKYNGFGVKKNK